MPVNRLDIQDIGESTILADHGFAELVDDRNPHGTVYVYLLCQEIDRLTDEASWILIDYHIRCKDCNASFTAERPVFVNRLPSLCHKCINQRRRDKYQKYKPERPSRAQKVNRPAHMIAV